MIYICIPTHDEEQTIGVMLWKIRTVMADFQRDYQILVADDASTDATQEVLEPYTRILPLTVFRSPQRRGYAASLEMLLREAVRRSTYPKRDIIVTLQADFTDEPAEIPSLVKRIEGGADIVTSNMRPGLDRAPRSVRWTWRLLGFLLRRMKWPEGVSDPISGFRAYRLFTVKKAIETRSGALLGGWEGWAANAALLRAVVPFARRVEEAQVTVRYDRRTRPTRFRPMDASRDVLRFVRRAGRNGQVPVADTAIEPIDATGVEVRAAESVVERPASGRGAAGRDRRAGATSARRGERTAAEGERKRTSSRTRGGRGRKREAREPEAATGSAVEAAAATVDAATAPVIEPGAVEAPVPEAAATEAPASTAAETAAGAEKAAGGDTGDRPQARRSRGRRSGGGRSRRGGAARETGAAEGAPEGAAENDAPGALEAADASEPSRTRAPRGGKASAAETAGGETSPAAESAAAAEAGAGDGPGDADTGAAAPSGSRAGESRRRGRRGGRRGGSGRGASARNAEPDAAGAPESATESEQSME